MKQRLENRRMGQRAADWALFYLRMFLGGATLLHNADKIHGYNEIIDSYPALLHVNSVATFLFVMLIEVSMALLLIVGFRVRFAAALLAGMSFVALIYTLPAENMERIERLFLMFGILLAPVIGGGGAWSLDGLRAGRNFHKKGPIEQDEPGSGRINSEI